MEEDEGHPIWVKMLIEYETEEFPDAPHIAYYEFTDLAPEFSISEELIDTYRGMRNAEFNIWHSEMPEGKQIKPTHFPLCGYRN